MCGIVGVYNLNKNQVNQNSLKEMVKVIKHRGPDDEGFYIKENLGLGHCRLSIIDLSQAGHQPMFSNDKTLSIVHNGEIYNFIEIRNELQGLGYKFKSNTDTEVILYSYQQWGVDCLKKFNGMWAFAIWDAQRKLLFCSRDRFGIKPFYYFFNTKSFVFGSEIKALFLCPFIKKEPNDKIIYDYLARGSSDHTDQTFFKNIKQLQPGHYLIIKQNKFEIKKYYELCFNPKIGYLKDQKAQEYSYKFINLLKGSVKLRLRSDVSIGTCLSGGLDSSTIVCLINELLKQGGVEKQAIGERQKTFSSCFNEQKFDERKYIEKVAEKTSVQSHYVFPSQKGLWQEIEELIWHQEEPFCSTSVYAQWNVMKLAKQKGVKVLLDGQGGDELLAGYPGYADLYFSQLFSNARLLTLAKEFYAKNKITGYSAKNLLQSLLKELVYYYLPLNLRHFLKRNTKQKFSLINPDFVAKYKHREKKQARHKLRPNFQKELWQSETGSGLRQLLRYEDKNSMAFSIETRVPFIDYRLVEFVFSLPGCYKIYQGWTKYLLRIGTKDLLPKEITWRRHKMGFVTPETIWLKNSHEKIKRIFKARDFMAKKYINQRSVLNKLDYCLNKQDADVDVNVFELWKFINLELWLKKMF